ncbi:MAG: DMT family transporter [Gammaproteobacteria bacterium]|nr:DMT family transporter [Gammaproteobacteria bacterium]
MTGTTDRPSSRLATDHTAAKPSPDRFGSSGTSLHGRAMLLMVLSCLLLTLNDTIVKTLAANVPPGQVIAVRGGLMVGLILAWLCTGSRLRTLRVRSWRDQMLRGLLMAGSTFCFVTGLSLLPLADAIAIAFAGPVLATAMAPLVLGERVGIRRWMAVLIGFAGVLVMLRPTPELMRWAALFPLAAALFGAGRDVLTRKMGTAGESSASMMLLSTVVITVTGTAGSVLIWVPLEPLMWVGFVASALLFGGAQLTLIEALRIGEVGLVGPFKYTSLVWAILLGIVVFGDWPDGWTLLGAVLVVGAGVYIAQREHRLART